MTMVDTLYDGHYKSREKLAFAFAEILNEEARAIEQAGVAVVQFDEPAFNVYFDEVRDWGVAALERAAAGLRCKTAVHICYGYGIKANIEWKKTLGSQWRQYEADVSPARPLGHRARCRSSAPTRTFRSSSWACWPARTCSSARSTSPTTRWKPRNRWPRRSGPPWRSFRPSGCFPCTNCGMVPLSREVARGKLRALAAGADIVRRELPQSSAGQTQWVSPSVR